MELLITLFLIVVGYFSGRHFEKSHFKKLDRRERSLAHVPITMGKPLHNKREGFTKPYQDAELFVGSVVISIDYFKRVASNFRNIFGGRMTAYETLLERGRREAILRMKEDAVKWGAKEIAKVRLESASITKNANPGGGSIGSIEVIAYGTGLR